MKTTASIDAARLELLLTDLRLPAVKLMWKKLAEQSDKEGWPASRFLAALAEHEVAERGRRRIERHLAEARLAVGKTLATFDRPSRWSARQVMALAAQCTAGAYFGKYVIVVDDDVDPTNVNQVLWAMATRSRPAQSIDILRETWSTYLDPSLNPPEIRPWGSKCLINACMDYRFIKTFSKRTKLSKDAYDNVVARWQELGLSGTPPVISVFEDEKSPEKIT